jgi:hypothetical protein
MLFESSGRSGFDEMTLPDDCITAASAVDLSLLRDRSVVVAMLTREETLRHSSRVQVRAPKKACLSISV